MFNGLSRFRRCFNAIVTLTAGVFDPNVFYNFNLRRNDIRLFRGVFSDFMQSMTTAANLLAFG